MGTTVSHTHRSCAVCGSTDKPLLYSSMHKFFWCRQCKWTSSKNKTEFLSLQVQEIFIPYYVYALLDPRDQSVRYIGLSKQPEIRLTQHASNKLSKQRYTWVQELRQQGLEPELKIIETVGRGKKYAFKRETYWIRYFIEQHAPLLNISPGFRENR